MAMTNNVTQIDDDFEQEESSEDLAKKNRFARKFYVVLGIVVIGFLWAYPSYIQFLNHIKAG